MRRTKTEYTPANSSKNCAPMDLNMPIMDGFQALHKLKSNPETEHIPVIILTARIDIESERRCLQAGVTDYIKKPWQPNSRNGLPSSSALGNWNVGAT